MKQPYLNISSSLVLCSLLGLYAPAYAEAPAPATAIEEPQATPEEQPSQATADSDAQEEQAAAEAETSDIELSYTINDGAMQSVSAPIEQLFKSLLEIVKASIAEAAKTPDQSVATQILLPYPEDMTESVEDDLPNLSLQTKVGADQKGETQFTIEAFESDISKEEEEVKGKLSWLGLTGNMTYTGALESPAGSFKAPGLTIGMGKEGSLKLEALSVSGSLDKYFEPLTLDFKLPQFKFDSEEVKILVDNFSGMLNLTEAKDGVKLGSAEFKLKDMQFNVEQQLIAVKDINFNATSAMQNETLLKQNTQLNIGNIILPKDAQNEMGGLNDLKMQLKLDISNIDAATVASIQTTMRQLEAQGMAAEMMGIAMMGKFMEAGPALLKQSPKIAIQPLEINTNQGKVTASLNLSFDGSQPVTFEKPEQLVQAVLGDAKVQISKELLKKMVLEQVRGQMPEGAAENPNAPKPEDMAEMQIQAFIQQKFLVDSGETYTMEANLKAGKLLVNGQETPLPF